jgi:hypothetical protein
MKLVSIGIPTYKTNIKKFKETIKSIFSQDYKNLEIIISENYPNNKSLENYINKLKKNFNKIYYYKQKNFISQVANWDFVINKFNGTYGMLLGDDDKISKNYIKTSVKIFKNDSKIYGVSSKWFHIFPNNTSSLSGGPTYSYMQDNHILRISKYLFNHNDVFVNALMRTKLVQKVGFKKNIKNYWWPNNKNIANAFTQFLLICLVYGKGSHNPDGTYYHTSIAWPRNRSKINLYDFFIEIIKGNLRYFNLFINFFIILSKKNLYFMPIYLIIVLSAFIKNVIKINKKNFIKIKRFIFQHENLY